MFAFKGPGATIVENSSFDPEGACKILKNATKGLRTDEDAIIEVLISHSCDQRQEMRQKFESLYGKNLYDHMKSELRGDFQDGVLALLDTVPVFLARQLRKAMKGIGTDECALIDILFPKTNEEIEQIKAAYQEEIGRDLVDDVTSNTRGDFKHLFVAQLSATRDESPLLDEGKAQQDAQEIYDAGEAQWRTDESTFIAILCDRSFIQLRAMFEAYFALSGKDIEKSIKGETRGNLEDGLLAIVQYAKNGPKYFADLLRSAMKGLGTDQEALIRTIISRSEVDLVDIAQEYSNAYGKKLTTAVEKDCRRDFKKLLSAVVGDR